MTEIILAVVLNYLGRSSPNTHVLVIPPISGSKTWGASRD